MLELGSTVFSVTLTFGEIYGFEVLQLFLSEVDEVWCKYIFGVTGYLSLSTSRIISTSIFFFTSKSYVIGFVAVSALH
jgi:hypothetical protein